MFVGDWSEGPNPGRSHAAATERAYKATSEVFMEGQPLNVTDLEVGPDGALYFITGGRGTNGGVYRVRWRGTPPKSVTNLGTGISGVIRQPQMHSAWGRQKIATLRIQMDKSWEKSLKGVALSRKNPDFYRTRALDLLQLFGPPPSVDLLTKLAADSNELVRAKSAEMMGMHSDAKTQASLIALLDDSDGMVRRKACEALRRAEQSAPINRVLPLLNSADRFESWAGRRLLETIPTKKWKEEVLTSEQQRVFIQGAVALMITEPSKENGVAIVKRFQEFCEGFVSDRDFLDMLRTVQVAIHRGKLTNADVPDFGEYLAEEYPSGNSIMNRELIRILAALEVDAITDRYVDHLFSDVKGIEKLHLALHLRFIQSGWSDEQRISLFEFLETMRREEGGGSYSHYVMNVTRDFAKQLSPELARKVFARGAEIPSAALGALYKLPEKLDDELLDIVEEMDKQIAFDRDEAMKPLRIGLVAILARSGDERSKQILRKMWESDPERRVAIASVMARQPTDEDYQYLVKTLPLHENPQKSQTLKLLRKFDQNPEDPEAYRQVILAGLILGENGSTDAQALLEQWTGITLGEEDSTSEEIMEAWQQWYHVEYPNRPEATIPEAPEGSKWKFEQLLEQLKEKEGEVEYSAAAGSHVFTKAQCAKCHRFGAEGESLGPDLSTIARRFTKKEILESILFPSHVVSDQYASKTIVTVKGSTVTGIVAPGGQGEIVVLKSDGTKARFAEDEVDDVIPSRVSTMPAGLLDELSLEEIQQLFGYLDQAAPSIANAQEPNVK